MNIDISHKKTFSLLSIWIIVLYPIFESLISVNLEQQTGIIHLIELGIAVLLIFINIFIYKKKIVLVKERFRYFFIIFVVFIGINLATNYTASNNYILENLQFYTLPCVLVILFLVNDQLFFSAYQYHQKKYYNYPIIMYLTINLLGCFLIFIQNDWYVNFTQGDYVDVTRYYRYNFFQYSGVFAWPNLLAYATAGIFIITKFAPVSNIVRYSLLILIFLSFNRSVMLVLLFIILIENRRFIRKNIVLASLSGIIVFLYLFVFKFNYFYEIIRELINEFFGTGATLNYRVYMIKNSYQLFSENFLIGIGLRRISDVSTAIENGDTKIRQVFGDLAHTSDTFWIIYAEIGLIGLFLLVLLILRIFLDTSSELKYLTIFLLAYSYSLSNPLTNYTIVAVNCLILAFYFRFSDNDIAEKNHNAKSRRLVNES